MNKELIKQVPRVSSQVEGIMNTEQPIEVEFWEEREFWRHGRPISERRRLNRSERMPCLGDLKCFNTHLWQVTYAHTFVPIVRTPASPSPVTIVFCVDRGAVEQLI
jgi:hypothetical protein